MCTCAFCVCVWESVHVPVFMQYCMCGAQRMTSQSLLSPSISTWVLRSKLRFPGLHNKHIYLLSRLTALETFGIIRMNGRTSLTNSHMPINQIHQLPTFAYTRLMHTSIRYITLFAELCWRRRYSPCVAGIWMELKVSISTHCSAL